MRRYLLTLLFVLVLLAFGGVAIYRFFGGSAPTQGPYIPTLSPDPQIGQTEGLILVGSVVGVLVSTFGLGAGMAFAFNQFTKTQTARVSERETASAPPPPSKAAPKAAGEGPQLLLSSQRSLAIFWTALAVLVVGFLIINSQGRPLGKFHTLSDMANVQLFKLPGEHLTGLPSFIAGPGDYVTALHLFLAVVGGAVAATLVVGVGLARAFAVLDEKTKIADGMPRTFVDRLMASAEARLQDLLTPKPRVVRTPPSFVDRGLLLLDAALLLVVAAIVVIWVIPSFSGVAVVDKAIEATRLAANVTPPAAATQGPSSLEALQAEFNALPKGDAAAGKAVFSSAGCVACHSLETGVKIVGPSLKGVVDQAPQLRPGYPPEVYFYESITRPDAYVVEGFQPGTMPQTFKQILKPQELADVIAFLMTQK